MESKISRRDFLKFGVSGLTAALSPFLWQSGQRPFQKMPPGDDPFPMRAPAYTLGRAALSGMYYAEPSFESQQLSGYNSNTVFKIYEETTGAAYQTYNPKWYQTDKGWVNAAYVLPASDEKNVAIMQIPAGGFLGEISVPYTWVWSESRNGQLKRKYAYYYAMTVWVDYVSTDKNTGIIWYRIFDDLEEKYYWIPAEQVRPIPPEEVAPISPDAPAKRIEVLLSQQTLLAYEGGQVVFSTPVSTGAQEGDTKPGEYVIERKRPVRHMAPMEGNGYDLPGVPWVCFISWTGVSIHGTYWHNNFGFPMSHGCINLPTPAAKWIYLWTMPVVPADVQHVKADGTPVTVIA